MKIIYNITELETGDIVVDIDSPEDELMAIYANGYWCMYHIRRNCITHEKMSIDNIRKYFKIICKNENCKIVLN